MSSSPRPNDGPTRHLDLTGHREVVYCHICHHEWYNDEQPGLQCPSCHNDFCEIVRTTSPTRPLSPPLALTNLPQITPDNDPREIAPPSPDDHASGFPDPDEDDIAAALPPLGFLNPQDRRGRGPGSPVDPSSDQEIFTRFQETLNMLMGFGGPMAPPGRSNRETLFGGSTQTRTYRSPGGRATFSITTSTGPEIRGMGHNHERGEHDHSHDDDFEMYGHPLHRRPLPGIPEVTFVTLGSNADRRPRIFGDAMGGVRPPQAGPPGFESNLHGLFSVLFGPGLMGPNAVHGDAVYSQEALDRIITQLMEANPQSNAAPPATEQAIEKLEKKKLDKEMIGESDKAECTICIDEMHEGDEVTVLPCKHWFHGDCVVLWLKEHNTCPICRAPIEKRDGNGGSADATGSGSDHQRRASVGAGLPTGPPRFGDWFVGGRLGSPWRGGATDPPSHGSTPAYQTRGIPDSEDFERSLNAIRGYAGPSSYGPAQPDSPRYRRDSWSPTSPPPGASSARDRSPVRPRPDRTDSSGWSSQRSGRSSHNSGGNGGSSANPINWIRGRFGGGGSNSNDDRSRRRS